MFAKSCPKVSLQSHINRESYDAKFGMDECGIEHAQNIHLEHISRKLLLLTQTTDLLFIIILSSLGCN